MTTGARQGVFFRARLFFVVAVVFVPGVSVGAGKGHPQVIGGAGCVTHQCHARLLEVEAAARAGSAHQPAVAGDCVSCHDLALAAESSFVKGVSAAAVGGSESARAWDLVLCSSCHGEGLLAPGATPGATGFMDGKRNLHAHHVQAGRGRRCLPCHDPHSARQPMLLRERIPARGGAQIAQEFRAEPKGGWCKTGCHAPKSYER